MTNIEAMKNGYEYIRDRKKDRIVLLYDWCEYVNDCRGYINCLRNLKLITSSQYHVLYDFMMEDEDIDIK